VSLRETYEKKMQARLDELKTEFELICSSLHELVKSVTSP
jgi:hypothetical protein